MQPPTEDGEKAVWFPHKSRSAGHLRTNTELRFVLMMCLFGAACCVPICDQPDADGRHVQLTAIYDRTG